MASIFLVGITNPAIAKQELFEGYKRVIAIDPGHGGDELGAKGPDGTTEKSVTLSLARILATDGSWAAFVRISRRGFTGRSIYRHLEDPDE